jgi:hypothetical protein
MTKEIKYEQRVVTNNTECKNINCSVNKNKLESIAILYPERTFMYAQELVVT